MSGLDAFGPNLRRLRMQRGITLDQISNKTKINAELLAGLERNDFAKWPTGIFARAFVRAYANAIREEPEAVVHEFCKWFPQGDRRLAPTIRVHAEIVGHDNLVWKDDMPRTLESDRRGTGVEAPLPEIRASRRSIAMNVFGQMFMRLRRQPR
ncbi:MAG TPA: helix-turn-helix transcriptional regulator [Vicinamibacterales bacterium]